MSLIGDFLGGVLSNPQVQKTAGQFLASTVNPGASVGTQGFQVPTGWGPVNLPFPPGTQASQSKPFEWQPFAWILGGILLLVALVALVGSLFTKKRK